MIKVKIFWRKMGSENLVALYIFEDEKTEAIIEALNSISENPIEPAKVCERWPLGRKGRPYKAPRGGRKV